MGVDHIARNAHSAVRRMLTTLLAVIAPLLITISAAAFQIPEKGCALYIDLDNLNMLVYVDGQPYKAYPVSGGTRENPSPVGLWKITEISNWGEGFGGSWLGLSVPWGHYGIHGTVAPWFLGEYNASHGCIRMRDEDAAAVKKLVSIGTPVYIKNTSLPFRPLKNGMIGSDVQQLQQQLRRRQLYWGPMNGVFSTGTEAAVRRFQKTHGLPADGIVGRCTAAELNR